jgi:hypothetical protein
LAVAGAAGGHSPAVRLDDGSDDRQSQAGALPVPALAPVAAVKAIKDVGQFLGSDALTGILNSDLYGLF